MGIPLGLQVDADLVGPAGEQLAAHQARSPPSSPGWIRRGAPRAWRTPSPRCARSSGAGGRRRVAEECECRSSLWGAAGLRRPRPGTPSPPAAPCPDPGADAGRAGGTGQYIRRLGDQHHPGRSPGRGRFTNPTLSPKPGFLPAEVPEQGVEQRPVGMTLGGVRHHARRLVQGEEPVVLVEDGEGDNLALRREPPRACGGRRTSTSAPIAGRSDGRVTADAVDPNPRRRQSTPGPGPATGPGCC